MFDILLRFSVAILVYSWRRGIMVFSSSMLPDCFHHWTLSLISADELFCWPIQLAWQFLCLSGFRWLSWFIQGDAASLVSHPPRSQLAPLIVFTIERYYPYPLMDIFADLSNKRGSSCVSQVFGGYLGLFKTTRAVGHIHRSYNSMSKEVEIDSIRWI